MASCRRKSSSSSSRRGDRISGLPGEILGHVLSFLPTKEAARAAVLGRRWRDVFASVHTISFDPQSPRPPRPCAPATMSRSSLSPSSSSPPCRPSDLLVPNLRYPGRPDYILLDSCGHTDLVADNGTTAETFTEATKNIKVTFLMADPPGHSSFCVRCPDLGDNPFTREPKIVWSVEDLALLRVDLATSGSPEYFIYRAGRLGCGPSLDLLPDVGSYFGRERVNPYLFGVVPDGDGKDFVLAAYTFKLFYRKPKQYKLHVFRSKRQFWTEELLTPDFPSWLNSDLEPLNPCKVIALRDGVLGFVDLWRGILLCNVLNDPVTACYIPLPKLLPNNREHYGELLGRPIRDVTCTDGLIIRCVEMEDLYSLSASIPDASNMDVLFDYEAVDPHEEAEEYDFVGWRLITWFRKISWDYWHKGSMVHVDELGTVSLPQLEDDGRRTGKLSLKDLKISCPILCGDDVVCLMSKLDQKAWVITVDMLKKAVREPMPCDAKRSFSTYIPCALHKYLKIESDGVHIGMHDARSCGCFTPQPIRLTRFCSHPRNTQSITETFPSGVNPKRDVTEALAALGHVQSSLLISAETLADGSSLKSFCSNAAYRLWTECRLRPSIDDPSRTCGDVVV